MDGHYKSPCEHEPKVPVRQVRALMFESKAETPFVAFFQPVPRNNQNRTFPPKGKRAASNVLDALVNGVVFSGTLSGPPNAEIQSESGQKEQLPAGLSFRQRHAKIRHFRKIK